ncbi:helicase, RecD/TraA family [Listeria fleischmannii subsp. coloradonensis]|nr:helicase, RecD/TraA family [Listeria fleischmannii subsp. coloradonensis]
MVYERHCDVYYFHNPDNLFSVVRLLVKETNTTWDEKDIIVTGVFPKLHEQEVYMFYGKITEHAKFGEQFKAEKFRKEMPQTKAGIIQYLSGELFKGIGKRPRKILWTCWEKTRFPL